MTYDLKTTLRDHPGRSAVSEPHAPRRLIAQWHKDAENALVMRVDFVRPRAHKGKKEPGNLVACCTPCNTIKGTRVYANFEAAKAEVQERREELHKVWLAKTARPKAKAAST